MRRVTLQILWRSTLHDIWRTRHGYKPVAETCRRAWKFRKAQSHGIGMVASSLQTRSFAQPTDASQAFPVVRSPGRYPFPLHCPVRVHL